MKSNYRRIGDFIRLVDERNKGLKVTNLVGLSISKQFIKSVANTIGTDMENYKIIGQNQFACSTMQVRRDKKMPVALYTDIEPAIISQAYPVFEIIDTSVLLPEYLMMWFSRSEFDREACFYAVGGVRGSLEWEDFENMQLPIPSMEKQQEIVREYNTIVNRIAWNEQLNQKLEETAQAIYKQWFVDNPSRDGVEKMLSDLVELSKETTNPQKSTFKELLHYSIPDFDSTGLPTIEKAKEIRSNKYVVKDNSILFSKLNPSFSRVWNLLGENSENAVCSTEFLVLLPTEIKLYPYIYYFLKSENTIEVLSSMATGTSNSHQRVKPNEILSLSIENFEINRAVEFGDFGIQVLRRVRLNLNEILKLNELKEVLLSKMTKVEETAEKEII